MNEARNSVGGGCCDTLTSSDHKQPIIVAYEKPADMNCEVYDARGNGEGGGGTNIDR